MADVAAAVEPAGGDPALTIPGLSVRVDVSRRVGALRYLHPDSIASTVAAAIGVPLPGNQEATVLEDMVLAWRSPTETLVVSDGSAAFEALGRALEGAAEACFVDQTGGVRVVRISGALRDELLARIGSSSCVPSPGRAVVGRMAELAVMSVYVGAGEYLLLVERVYEEHLLGWIRETIADLRVAE